MADGEDEEVAATSFQEAVPYWTDLPSRFTDDGLKTGHWDTDNACSGWSDLMNKNTNTVVVILGTVIVVLLLVVVFGGVGGGHMTNGGMMSWWR